MRQRHQNSAVTMPMMPMTTMRTCSHDRRRLDLEHPPMVAMMILETATQFVIVLTDKIKVKPMQILSNHQQHGQLRTGTSAMSTLMLLTSLQPT
jgi:hypothetical protein